MDSSKLGGKKILVIGRPCSGKTTFAKALAEATGIPLHDLDDIYWKKGWQRTSDEHFMQLLGDTVRRDEWILSGNYLPTLSYRLRHCTDVVVLDCSWYAAAFRYLRRIRRRARGLERNAAHDAGKREFGWSFFLEKILLYSKSYIEFNATIAAAPAGVTIHDYDANAGLTVRSRVSDISAARSNAVRAAAAKH